MIKRSVEKPTVEDLVRAFVADLETIWNEKTQEKVRTLFGGAQDGKATAKGYLHSVKRSPEALEQLCRTVFSALPLEGPGLRCEEISKKTGISTGDLALPIKKLGKQLKWEGVARGRRYWIR